MLNTAGEGIRIEEGSAFMRNYCE